MPKFVRPKSEEEEDEHFAFLRQVGLRVKVMRTKASMTRRDLTTKANIKAAYGYIIEEEGVNFTLKTLINIANALGCLPRDLMPDPPPDEDLEGENRFLREQLEHYLKIFEELATTIPAMRDHLEKSKRLRGY